MVEQGKVKPTDLYDIVTNRLLTACLLHLVWLFSPAPPFLTRQVLRRLVTSSVDGDKVYANPQFIAWNSGQTESDASWPASSETAMGPDACPSLLFACPASQLKASQFSPTSSSWTLRMFEATWCNHGRWCQRK